MRPILVLLTALLLLTPVSHGTARGHDRAHAPEIIGKKARRQIRQHLYWHNLKADKRRIYKEHGFTPQRLRIDRGQGRINEQWRYLELGLEFTFDKDSRLIEARRIPPENGSVD